LQTRQSIATPLIQHYEAFRADAYLCPAGVWTIGWGSTGSDIKRGMRWTRAQADARFAADLQRFGDAVMQRVRIPLQAHEQAALVSLAYNIGVANFSGSTLLRKLNGGERDGAAAQFAVWNKARVNGKLVVLRGLVTRRAHEARIFRGEG
jgi:lysozyme